MQHPLVQIQCMGQVGIWPAPERARVQGSGLTVQALGFKVTDQAKYTKQGEGPTLKFHKVSEGHSRLKEL